MTVSVGWHVFADTARILVRHDGRVPAEQAVIRPYAVEDRAQVLAMDSSFVCDSIYRISRVGDSFLITTTPAEPPRLKAFDLHDALAEAAWDLALVAVTLDTVAAFCATGFEPWHRRQVLGHLYVDAAWRRRGLGRRLVAAVSSRGMDNGANHLWLETTNANVQAVRAYGRMGFALCGLDVDLYRGTPDEGETGLFMSRDIPGR